MLVSYPWAVAHACYTLLFDNTQEQGIEYSKNISPHQIYEVVLIMYHLKVWAMVALTLSSISTEEFSVQHKLYISLEVIIDRVSYVKQWWIHAIN